MPEYVARGVLECSEVISSFETLLKYPSWSSTASTHAMVLTSTQWMKNRLNCFQRLRRSPLWKIQVSWDYQLKCWMGIQGAAVVVGAEEHPRILQWQLPAFLDRKDSLLDKCSLAHSWANCLIRNSWMPLSTAPSSSFTMTLANTSDADLGAPM